MAKIDASKAGAAGSPGEHKWTKPPLGKIAQTSFDVATEVAKLNATMQETNKLLNRFLDEKIGEKMDTVVSENVRLATELLNYLREGYFVEFQQVMAKLLGITPDEHQK